MIGVMPEGFGFPVHHSLWLPLRLDEDRPPGPGLRAFGRLAADADLDRAQAEADALTSRIDWSAEGLDHSPVAQVLSYRESLFDRPVSLLMRAILLQVNAFGALFLVLVAANVALLLFARAAARERELAVRTALGATRGRIVLQLFVEALALSLLAAACGLAATAPALHWVAGRMTAMGGGTPPFWFQPGVSPATALYAVVLAVVAAAVAGIMPALKATGRDVTVRLTQGSAGGGGPRFGGIWTAVVITQIAVMVVFADGATLMVRQAWRTASPVPALRAEDVLTLRIERDELTAADRPDGALVEQFSRRLAAEPGVAGVTVTSRLPVARPAPTQMALETPARASRDPDSTGAGLIAAGVVAVDRGFFDVFEAPVIAGRGFEAADFAADPRAVVVDRYFVDTVLGGRGAVGRRIRVVDGRRPDQPGPWLQIVGVVETLAPPPPGGSHLDDPARPIVYRPRGAAATTTPVFVALRVPAGVESQRSRLTEIARSVSPAIRLHDVRTLAEAADTEVAFWRLWAQLLVLVSAVALFLSLAGIYAATAFAVSRRTREIGIRVALGASTPRIAATIVRRPVTHVASGVVAGCALVAGMLTAVTDGVTTADGVRLLALGAGLVVVCTAACLGPMRRALRVQPTDALGSDT
ncbi:MAG: FtsX-like permease family protein [Vicinamibacterales bacterium]